MRPVDLIRELDRIGVDLVVEGDKLRFRPVDRVPPEVLAALRTHKGAVMRLVRVRGAVQGRIVTNPVTYVPRAGTRDNDTSDQDDRIMPGWTRGSWRQRLTYLADACRTLN